MTYNFTTTTVTVTDSLGNSAFCTADITVQSAAGIYDISDVSISEGNSGTTMMNFTVTLTGASCGGSIDYSTADSTATIADNDYVATSGPLTFAPGESTKTVSVLINGDTTEEPDEIFSLNISNASNGATITTCLLYTSDAADE